KLIIIYAFVSGRYVVIHLTNVYDSARTLPPNNGHSNSQNPALRHLGNLHRKPYGHILSADMMNHRFSESLTLQKADLISSPSGQSQVGVDCLITLTFERHPSFVQVD